MKLIPNQYPKFTKEVPHYIIIFDYREEPFGFKDINRYTNKKPLFELTGNFMASWKKHMHSQCPECL